MMNNRNTVEKSCSDIKKRFCYCEGGQLMWRCSKCILTRCWSPGPNGLQRFLPALGPLEGKERTSLGNKPSLLVWEGGICPMPGRWSGKSLKGVMNMCLTHISAVVEGLLIPALPNLFMKLSPTHHSAHQECSPLPWLMQWSCKDTVSSSSSSSSLPIKSPTSSRCSVEG